MIYFTIFPVLIWIPNSHIELYSTSELSQTSSSVLPSPPTIDIKDLSNGNKLYSVNIVENLDISAAFHGIKSSSLPFPRRTHWNLSLGLQEAMLLLAIAGLGREILSVLSLHERFTMGEIFLTGK